MAALTKKSKVRAIIIDEIKSERLKPGQKLENERALSERLGVSRLTLSRGLKDLVDQGVLIKKVGSGTFVARDPIFTAPVGQKLSIGLMISNHNSPLVLHLINGLHQVLPPERCDIILKDPGGDPELERKMMRALMERGADGVIVSTCHSPNSEDGRRFYEEVARVFPLVMTDCVVNGKIPSVTTNNLEGGRLAGEWLCAKANGGKRFWVVGTPHSVSSLEQRTKGFRSYIGAWKGAVVEEIVVTDLEDIESNELAKAIDEKGIPDGVFVTQDILLNLFIKALMKKGETLDHLNVCTYDNFHGVADLFGIPYIQQPFEEIGTEISRYLALLRTERDKPVKQILLGPCLITPSKV